MDYPIFIKLYDDPNSIFIPLSDVRLFCTDTNYIDSIINNTTRYFCIVDKDNNVFNVKDFKCKTIEELYVALDINNLIYGVKNFSVDEALKKEHEELIGLREENKQLKQTIKEFKESIKSFNL